MTGGHRYGKIDAFRRETALPFRPNRVITRPEPRCMRPGLATTKGRGVNREIGETMAGVPRHPSTRTTAELLSLCRAERLALGHRALVLKRQLRGHAAELTIIEQQLDILHESEESLLSGQADPSILRVVK
jgi:hypothetical protein